MVMCAHFSRSCGSSEEQRDGFDAKKAMNTSADEWKAIADSLKGQVWDFESEAPIPIAGKASGKGCAPPSPLPLDGPPSEAPGLHHGSFFR